MKAWSRKHKNCTNCHTDRYPHVARGFCTQCYPLLCRKEQLSNWNLSNPASMKGFPPSLLPFLQTQAQVEAFKVDAKEQIQSRLNELRTREEKLNSEINGIDIEYQLGRIAKMVVPKGDILYHGSATLINNSFNMKQKKLLYRLLSRMEEKRPWTGIHYGKYSANALLKTFIEKVTGNQSDGSAGNPSA